MLAWDDDDGNDDDSTGFLTTELRRTPNSGQEDFEMNSMERDRWKDWAQKRRPLLPLQQLRVYVLSCTFYRGNCS